MKNIKRLFDIEKKQLKAYGLIADQVFALEDEMKALSDDELRNKTDEFIERLNNDETLESIQVEAFAVAREASFRATGMTPFRVQIIGAAALFDGNIAEMKTGEGKTLTSAITAYTWSLAKKGVHVVTVNDYLASRDAENNGKIYDFLGVTYGLNERELTREEKQEAYNADITYTTNSELGFDYLRDNMVMNGEDRVGRGQFYTIIDEVDSILIDEARTPLIISGSDKQSLEMYTQVDAFVKSLKEERDFKINIKDKIAHILPHGIEKAEQVFGVGNLFDVENSQLIHSINQSLKANFCMHNDFDYVVQNGEVVIVDQFTGRTMEGRVFSDGLHQAIEAKEHVKTQRETKTMATITYQNYFRLYDKLSGMTGTAKTEEEEFQKTYYVDVVSIPTNVPVLRVDRNDIVFKSKGSKIKHIIELVKERHAVGQPILIGTVAIESSEEISVALRKIGIKHQVLNAKQNEHEAEIIARAGQKGVVTIATNMAGRGTDIKLSDEVRNFETYYSELDGKDVDYAGLLIIGTERHESRRIDNQLRGRSGRQGDKGESIFYVSFDDDILKRYAQSKAFNLLNSLPDDEPISLGMLTKQLATAQKQVESIHYEMRKTLLKYDDVLREQREIMYQERDYVIASDDLIEDSRKIITDYCTDQVEYYTALKDNDGLNEFVERTVTSREFEIDFAGNVLEQVLEIANGEFDRKVELHGEEAVSQFAKAVMIKVIDGEWINHIDEMQILREAVGLRGYGQIDPLIEYQRDGRAMFDDMIETIAKEITRILLKGRIQTEAERERMIAKLQAQHNKVVNEPTSTFVKDAENKVGRNDPCPCGSGKKYKNCHGA